MANINFLYRSKSKKEIGAITLRLIHKNKIDLFINTGYISHKKFWFKSDGKKYDLPYGRSAEPKRDKEELVKLENYIIEIFNQDYNSGIEISKDWLQEKIDIFFKRRPENENEISQFVIDNVERIIEEAPFKPNQKGGTGLSKGRINTYKAVARFILEYQRYKRRKFKIEDIDINFKNEFLKWFTQNKGYKISYGDKIIDTLKSVCLDASYRGVSINNQINKVTGRSKNNEYVIYLTEEEIRKIEETELTREALINTRKWMVLGCYIGQRSGDLLNISKNNIFERNGHKFIEITQEKTGKNITIPLLLKAKNIIENDMPYKISQQKLNGYIKEVCKQAGIDEIIEGSKMDKETKRHKVGYYSKYELITSHTFRRSFASNFYGKIPTSLLMRITGHSSEKTFLNYIGKNSYDFAEQMMEYVTKLENE